VWFRYGPPPLPNICFRSIFPPLVAYLYPRGAGSPLPDRFSSERVSSVSGSPVWLFLSPHAGSFSPQFPPCGRFLLKTFLLTFSGGFPLSGEALRASRSFFSPAPLFSTFSLFRSGTVGDVDGSALGTKIFSARHTRPFA